MTAYSRVTLFVFAALAGGMVHRSTVPPAKWAFTAPWDPRSDSSFRANASRLDVVVSGWIQLDSVTGLPVLLYRDTVAWSSARRRYALVTSWSGQRFHPEMVRQMATDGRKLSTVASRISRLIAATQYSGVVLDLEGQSREDTALTARVVKAIGDSVRRYLRVPLEKNPVVAVAVPALDTAAYPARLLVPAADLLVVMLYDEHWATSPPGPVASPLWVRRALAERVADVGADHIVAALPVYGYLWRGSRPAQALSFAEARRAATDAGVDLARDPVSGSLHAIQPGSWELWMTDAEAFRALLAEVTTLGVTRVALWRLGFEDPAVWR